MKINAWAFTVLLGLTGLSTSVAAVGLPPGPQVITTGTASVDAVPDIATLTIMVGVSSNDAADAKKQVDTRVAQYFDFLIKNGIATKDINAANLQTQPEFDFLKTGESVLKGYRAVRQVQVTVRQLDKLNDLLDGALKAGLNEIRGVELGVANPQVYRDQARSKAIENAITQAHALADGFKAQLGPIYSIRYHAANAQPTPAMQMFRTAGAMAQTSVEQTYAQQTIHFDDQVDAVFELQPNP